tara:strand:- start:2196 stop:3092 length:897 start_codon:yes stop_codon:yes gene_type:complete
MPQLDTEVKPEKVAGFVDSSYNKNRQRIEQEEKELEELMKEVSGEKEEEKAEPETEEVKAKEVPEEDDSKLTGEEKSFKKRYGDLRRHMSEKEKSWKEKFEALENRLSNEVITPPKSDEDIAAWAEKYPDVAGIVETIAQKKAQELFSKTENKIKELDQVQNEAIRTKAENVIRESHPDFDKLREADEFHTWADAQPKWVQNALYENADDPASVVRVIDLYKVDKGLTTKDKKAKSKAAASMVSKGSKTQVDADDSSERMKESDVAKMSAAEFEKRSDDITEAMRSGKFIYDISGNAR